MPEYDSDRYSVYPGAEVDAEGNLYVSEEHVAKESESESETSVLVTRGDKATVLNKLVRESPGAGTVATSWIRENKLSAAADDDQSIAAFLSAHGEYADTVLLLLLKERFKTQFEFSSWLAENRVHSQFHSES
jgi:hypothetical protein